MNDILLQDSIFDKASSYICILDAEQKIIEMNNTFAKIVNIIDRDSVVGKKIQTVVSSNTEITTFFSSITSNSISNVPFSPQIVPVYRSSEKQLWIKFEINELRSQLHGQCLYVFGIDVTEEIINKRNAEQKAHERNSFLVRMGHELRTPLNTVLGYAQLLQGLQDLSSVAKEYINTIIMNEYSLLHLLNDMFEHSKYEAGQTIVVQSETNIKKLLQETTRSYIDQFNSKYLSLSVEFITSIPEVVLTDPQKISHAVSNVLGNALKFTHKGGVKVSISCGKLLTIDIEDTGTGIAPEDQKDIFNVYNQTGSTKEHMAGTGIGLAVARNFCKLLGGDLVLVHSSIGSGSLFRCTFAYKTISTQKKETIQISDYTTIKGISKPCKVLLVDDVDINLAMLEIFLNPAGFEVSIASNGYEAIEKFKTFSPDIVFMDLIMPEKDGFEATREIKEINPKIPVIALTASIVDTIKELALEAGVNDFMSKPFIPERFFEIIAEYTDLTYSY